MQFGESRGKMGKSQVYSTERGGIHLKRRLFLLILCLSLMFTLAMSVQAESEASSIQIYASVNTDGDADVTMTVRLRLEAPVESLYFPLPLTATNIKMNDNSVGTTRGSTALMVNLSNELKNYTGDYVVTFKYTLPGVVTMVEDKLTLQLPLLSGFSLPVHGGSLTVMLPDTIQGRPVFKSTYHQDDIESVLNVSISNNLITGLITQPLKDHETLSMSMVVSPSMFGGVSTYVRVGNPEIVPMIICGVLALLYWLIWLRGFPLLRDRRATPPEGITAGELGCRLTFCGADLTMMVFTWAQLGYILIQLDDNGRVLLHKRMDMGNERSSFEVKIFKTLFGRRRTIDGTGNSYALLARQVSRVTPGRKSMHHPKSGNPKLFIWLNCAIGALCGICFAMNFSGMAAIQVILSIALGFLGGWSSLMIQKGMSRLHLRYKLPLWGSLVLGILWLILGIWCGQWVMGLCVVLVEMLAGLAVAYGGRRSDLGRQNAAGILGFRRYLKTVEKEDLKRIQQNDPEYFYNMLPYAMALGVDKTFAKRFGRKAMSPCPYFVCGISDRMPAEDWVRFHHETAAILDSRFRRLELERYMPVRFH